MIDKLVQLLNLSNVKKIIYVDDIFCVERYLEDAHAVLRTWLETDVSGSAFIPCIIQKKQ